MAQQVGNFQEAAASRRYQIVDQFNQLPELGAATGAGNLQWERFGTLSTATFNTSSGDMELGTDSSNAASVAIFPRANAGDPANITRLRAQPFKSDAESRVDLQVCLPANAIATDVTIALGMSETEAADLTTDANHGLVTITGGVLGASARSAGNPATVELVPGFSKTFVADEPARITCYFNRFGVLVFEYNGSPFAYQKDAGIADTVTLRPILWVLAPPTNTTARVIGVRNIGVGSDVPNSQVGGGGIPVF